MMMRKFILLVYLSAIAPILSSAQEKFHPELQVHLGRTGIHSRYLDGKRPRFDFTHLGYDLKVNYELFPKVFPYFALNGHKIFTTHQDLSSSYFQLGVGLGHVWEVFRKASIEFSRGSEKILHESNESLGETKAPIYRIKLMGEYSLFKIKNSFLGVLGGIGINFQGEKKVFKLNRGEFYSLGIGHRLPEEGLSDSYFISDAIFEKEILKATDFRQTRYSGLIRIGKMF